MRNNCCNEQYVLLFGNPINKKNTFICFYLFFFFWVNIFVDTKKCNTTIVTICVNLIARNLFWKRTVPYIWTKVTGFAVLGKESIEPSAQWPNGPAF